MNINGIQVANLNLSEAVEKVYSLINSSGKHLVVTLNPEMVLLARKNLHFRNIISRASLVIPDGVGIVLASYVFGNPLTKGRVTWVSLVERLLGESLQKGLRIYLVGSASTDVLNKTTLNLTNKYGKINVVGSSIGPNFSIDDSFPLTNNDNKKLIEDINNIKPDILLVAFGHGKQEIWLSHYLPILDVKLGIGVGGAFDYLSGLVTRPPKLFCYLGVEWLWRLIKQPKRFLRIFNAVVIFPFYICGLAVNKLFHVEQ